MCGFGLIDRVWYCEARRVVLSVASPEFLWLLDGNECDNLFQPEICAQKFMPLIRKFSGFVSLRRT